jgi:hypothetical protein
MWSKNDDFEKWCIILNQRLKYWDEEIARDQSHKKKNLKK